MGRRELLKPLPGKRCFVDMGAIALPAVQGLLASLPLAFVFAVELFTDRADEDTRSQRHQQSARFPLNCIVSGGNRSMTKLICILPTKGKYN